LQFLPPAAGYNTLTQTLMDMPPTPPVASPHAIVDIHHGIDVQDSYRHLENMADVDVQAWARGQAGYASAMLESIPGRDALRERIDAIAATASPVIGAMQRLPDGRVVYFKQPADADVARICMRDQGGSERVVVDPAELPRPADGGHLAATSFGVSPDSRLLLYGVAASGSEEEVLRVRDLVTGRDLPVAIDRIESVYVKPSWLPDNRSFTSSRRRLPEPGAPADAAYRFTQSFVHTLDDDGRVANEAFVFGHGAPGCPAMGPMDFPAVIVPAGSHWVIGQVNHGDESDISLWTLPIADLGKASARWRAVCTRDDLVTDFAVQGDAIYLVTATDAPRHKVVRTSLANPDLTTADTVVPAGETVVHTVATAADALYVGTSLGPVRGILRVPYEQPQKAAAIAMPKDEPSASLAAASPVVPGVLLRGGSWIRTGRIHAFEPQTAELADTGFVPVGPFDVPEGLLATEVVVTSHDGVPVPLSIIHKASLPRDGRAPTIVTGYGAYGHSIPMQFTPTSLAWLERGGVLAVAHVRGGGTFGKAWHHAGRKATKPNTWKDFLACAEYLVRERYTSPGHLCARGGSAGGILVGRAITERPDLFAAANVAVGCTDMLRFETTRNGPPNVPEFGSLADPEEFRGLLAMSTLHHVVDGVSYPAVILTHGMNDPRVEPWQSFKTAARLQTASSSGRPVLLRLDYDSGHGIGSTRSQRHAELADVQSFFLWQCGDPEFQPVATSRAPAEATR
jgi:prolyl oligopeptidase